MQRRAPESQQQISRRRALVTAADVQHSRKARFVAQVHAELAKLGDTIEDQGAEISYDLAQRALVLACSLRDSVTTAAEIASVIALCEIVDVAERFGVLPSDDMLRVDLSTLDNDDLVLALGYHALRWGTRLRDSSTDAAHKKALAALRRTADEAIALERAS